MYIYIYVFVISCQMINLLTYVWFMSHIRMSQDAHMNVSWNIWLIMSTSNHCAPPGWINIADSAVISHACMNQFCAHKNVHSLLSHNRKSEYKDVRATSQIWIRVVTRRNALRSCLPRVTSKKQSRWTCINHDPLPLHTGSYASGGRIRNTRTRARTLLCGWMRSRALTQCRCVCMRPCAC